MSEHARRAAIILARAKRIAAQLPGAKACQAYVFLDGLGLYVGTGDTWNTSTPKRGEEAIRARARTRLVDAWRQAVDLEIPTKRAG